MGTPLPATPAPQQDALRSVRNFVSLLSGATGDQTYAETDSSASNPSGRFMAQGPNGVTVEGQPVTLQRPESAGVSVSPMGLLLAALAIYFLVR